MVSSLQVFVHCERRLIGEGQRSAREPAIVANRSALA